MGAEDRTGAWVIEVFYDGACPVCAREMRFIQRLDTANVVRASDIAARDFDPAAVGPDLTRERLMDRIHGKLPDGSVVEGVEVFRRIYGALGFRRAVAVSRWPGVRRLLDVAYRAFARNRMRLGGRCVGGACAAHRAFSARP